jgi:hypothetical protein
VKAKPQVKESGGLCSRDLFLQSDFQGELYCQLEFEGAKRHGIGIIPGANILNVMKD